MPDRRSTHHQFDFYIGTDDIPVVTLFLNPVELRYFELSEETKNTSNSRKLMTERQIQGKKFRVRNNRKFEITEFKLAGSN